MAHTPRLKHNLHRASELAAELGHDYIGTEHVLLALLEDPDAVATQAVGRYVEPAELTRYLRDFMTSREYTTASA